MQFAFFKKYRFECKQCGACCLQRSLSLTDVEYQRLTRIVDHSCYDDIKEYNLTPELHLHEVSFKGKYCHFIEEGKICGIYESRFTTCRLFPLFITALPNGELLVNLMHCNGVSLSQGKLVDESFVRRVIDEANKADPSFLREFISFRKSYHNDLFPFYTSIDRTDFWTKRSFLNRIFKWFAERSPRSKSVDIRIRAVNEVLSEGLSMRLQRLFNRYRLVQPPLVVTSIDIEQMADELEKRLDEKLNKACKDAELKKQHEIKKVFSEGKAEILVEEKPRIFNLNESTTYSTPYLDKIKIKVRNLFIEKPLSNDATQLFEDYLAEVLNRVDHGGFSMDVPIIDILESLFRFSQNILTHAKVYSQESGKIEKDHLNDAIIYLDSRGILGLTTTNVVNEISRARQFRH